LKRNRQLSLRENTHVVGVQDSFKKRAKAFALGFQLLQNAAVGPVSGVLQKVMRISFWKVIHSAKAFALAKTREVEPSNQVMDINNVEETGMSFCIPVGLAR
jgi:hypothetical protein